jgi:hypothetical protein
MFVFMRRLYHGDFRGSDAGLVCARAIEKVMAARA